MSNQVDSLELTSPVIWTPTTAKEAFELKEKFANKAEFASGATLLQLQWTNGRKVPENLISLEQILALKTIQFDQNQAVLSIGAGTALGSYQTNKLLKEFPNICDALKSIAAPGIRNRGTIGGNIMGGIGDLLPFLLSLNAKLIFVEGQETTEVDLWEWLQQSARKEQLLTHIWIPLDKEILETYSFYRKVGRRETFTAAILTVSGKFVWDESGTILKAILAIGGGENRPMRLTKTEQSIIGKKGTQLDWKQIYSLVCDEFTPAEDVFVTGNYRKKVAANLIIAELQSQFVQNGQREEHINEI
ncbi:MAG TPA: FAD binding domain-containing protein [Ureibacillus sp.]|nr:FAD binding domain-containing protein [Ureibacillus sp.]